MYILNVSAKELETVCLSGTNRRLLIQINDPGARLPVPASRFEEVHQFWFHDIEHPGPCAITDKDAESIARLLIESKSKSYDVVVQCERGLGRSGAVVLAGIHLGFRDPGKIRWPNLLVLSKVLNYLGLPLIENLLPRGMLESDTDD